MKNKIIVGLMCIVVLATSVFADINAKISSVEDGNITGIAKCKIDVEGTVNGVNIIIILGGRPLIYNVRDVDALEKIGYKGLEWTSISRKYPSGELFGPLCDNPFELTLKNNDTHITGIIFFSNSTHNDTPNMALILFLDKNTKFIIVTEEDTPAFAQLLSNAKSLQEKAIKNRRKVEKLFQ